MATRIPDLKDLAFGDLNPVQVTRRKGITDSQLKREQKTDYRYSKDLVGTSHHKLAYVVERGREELNPFSWSLNARTFKDDTVLVVVKAVLIEETVSPGPDEDIECVDGVKISSEDLGRMHLDFIAVEPGMITPNPGDIIRVDFQNRKTKTGPIYLGIVEAGSNRAGAQTPSNPSGGGAFNRNIPESLANAPASAPLQSNTNAPIVSQFGWRKPINNSNPNCAPEFHFGVDIGIPENSNLFAIYSGQIIKVYNEKETSGAGRITVVVSAKFNQGDPIDLELRQYFGGREFYEGGEEIEYSFYHMNAVKVGGYQATYTNFTALSAPISVTAGQFIGLSGVAGTGDHLHLEISDKSIIPPLYSPEDEKKIARFKTKVNHRSPTQTEIESAINSTVTRARPLSPRPEPQD